MIVPRETDEFKPVWIFNAMLFRVSNTPLANVVDSSCKDLERSLSTFERPHPVASVAVFRRKARQTRHGERRKESARRPEKRRHDDDDDDDDDVSAPLLVAGAFPERFPDVPVRMESQ